MPLIWLLDGKFAFSTPKYKGCTQNVCTYVHKYICAFRKVFIEANVHILYKKQKTSKLNRRKERKHQKIFLSKPQVNERSSEQVSRKKY